MQFKTLLFLWADSWEARVKITINYILDRPTLRRYFTAHLKFTNVAASRKTQPGGSRMNELMNLQLT